MRVMNTRGTSIQLRLAAIVLLFLMALPASASPKAMPWMLEDWTGEAPHLADLGLRPQELARALDNRLLTFAHPERSVSLPGANGPRHFSNARFITTVARVDLPVQTLRRKMRDFSSYKTFFPMLTGSDVVAMNGKNQLVRFRIEIPMPALASFVIDFRFKQKLEDDGSISGVMIDGEAKSLVAMIGGMTDELKDQPVMTRWEFLPVSKNQSLLVFTYWDRVDFKNYFSRKLLEQYPELHVVGPYMISAGAVESIRHKYSIPVSNPVRKGIPDWSGLAYLQPYIERLSAFGYVGILEPEHVLSEMKMQKPLRYSVLATRVSAPPAQARGMMTDYPALPGVMKELKGIEVNDRGREIDLDLDIRFAFMVIRFSLDMGLRNTWASPERLEFRRTSGGLARLSGAAEWHPLPDNPHSLVLTTIAHEVGDEAPLVLRLAHRIVERIPFAEALAGMGVQIVVMERMKPWVEKQAAGARQSRP